MNGPSHGQFDAEYRVRIRNAVDKIERMRLLNADELKTLDEMTEWYLWWVRLVSGLKLFSEWLIRVGAAVALGFAAWQFVISKAVETAK